MEFCNVAFLFFNNLMFQKQIQTGLAVRSRNRLFYILLIPLKNIIQVPVGFKVSLSTTKSICSIQRYFYRKILTITTILRKQCGSTVLYTELEQKRNVNGILQRGNFFFVLQDPFGEGEVIIIKLSFTIVCSGIYFLEIEDIMA